jgi:phage FluMu protein Com
MKNYEELKCPECGRDNGLNAIITTDSTIRTSVSDGKLVFSDELLIYEQIRRTKTNKEDLSCLVQYADPTEKTHLLISLFHGGSISVYCPTCKRTFEVAVRAEV